MGSLLGYPQQLGKINVYQVRVGQLSRSSQRQNLPLGQVFVQERRGGGRMWNTKVQNFVHQK